MWTFTCVHVHTAARAHGSAIVGNIIGCDGMCWHCDCDKIAVDFKLPLALEHSSTNLPQICRKADDLLECDVPTEIIITIRIVSPVGQCD